MKSPWTDLRIAAFALAGVALLGACDRLGGLPTENAVDLEGADLEAALYADVIHVMCDISKDDRKWYLADFANQIAKIPKDQREAKVNEMVDLAFAGQGCQIEKMKEAVSQRGLGPTG